LGTDIQGGQPTHGFWGFCDKFIVTSMSTHLRDTFQDNSTLKKTKEIDF
jgi:hypothetical protein